MLQLLAGVAVLAGRTVSSYGSRTIPEVTVVCLLEPSYIRISSIVLSLLFGGIGLAGCGSPADTEAAQDLGPEQKGEVILRAGYSGFPTSERVVVRDDGQWEAIWEKAFALQASVPLRPAIDFATEMVVVAALGSRPTGGYGIAIEDLETRGTELAVFVTATSPGPSCFTTQAITQPVEMVRVRSVSGPVSFHERSLIHQCN